VFGIDVGSFEAKSFDIDLEELAIAAALWPLMAEYGPHAPHAPWRIVGEVVLDRGPHHARGELRAHRELFAIQPVLERVHLLFDDVGDFADAAHEQLGVFQDRRANLLIPV
jgi:hypothetical protein